MLTCRLAAETLHVLQEAVGLALLVLACEEMLVGGRRRNQLLGETEGILGVTTYGLILGQSTVDLILPQDVYVVAAEDEIAQEAQCGINRFVVELEFVHAW